MDDDLEDLPRRDWFREIVRAWMPMVLLLLSVRTYGFEPYRIPSGSMAPTLEIGDNLLVDKFSYGLWVPATGVDLPFADALWVAPRFELVDLGDPERGDIIVFRWPLDESQTYIKRVVGVPGDRVRVRDNGPSLDGVPQRQRSVGTTTYVDDACRSLPSRRYVEALGGTDHEVLKSAGPPGGLADWPRSGEAIEVPEDTVFVMGDNRDHSADSRSWGFVRFDQIKGKARRTLFSWDGCAARLRTGRLFRSLYGEP